MLFLHNSYYTYPTSAMGDLQAPCCMRPCGLGACKLPIMPLCPWCSNAFVSYHAITVTGFLPYELAGVAVSCGLLVLMIFMRNRCGNSCHSIALSGALKYGFIMNKI